MKKGAGEVEVSSWEQKRGGRWKTTIARIQGVQDFERVGGETVLKTFMVLVCLPKAPCKQPCVMPRAPRLIATVDRWRGGIWPMGQPICILACDLSNELSLLKDKMGQLDSLGFELWKAKRICLLIEQGDAENKVGAMTTRMDPTHTGWDVERVVLGAS